MDKYTFHEAYSRHLRQAEDFSLQSFPREKQELRKSGGMLRRGCGAKSSVIFLGTVPIFGLSFKVQGTGV